MENQNIKPTGCCEIFNPEPWDNKILEWNNKKFVKAKVRTLFYMPLNFGAVIVGAMKKIKVSGAVMQNSMCLSDHISKWSMNIYLEVDKEVAGMENTTLSGKFFSKVYEGDFKKTGEWCKDFGKLAKDRSFDVKKMYMWYTTCPKCAKAYGKNYIVIIGKIG
jgi:hypothetical protein